MIKDIVKLLSLASLYEDTYGEALLSEAKLNELHHNTVTILLGERYTEGVPLTQEQIVEGDKRIQEVLIEMIGEAEQTCLLTDK